LTLGCEFVGFVSVSKEIDRSFYVGLIHGKIQISSSFVEQLKGSDGPRAAALSLKSRDYWGWLGMFPEASRDPLRFTTVGRRL
jgi:hypothetical protein